MIDASYFWTNVFFLSLGTILIRLSIIALSTKIKISDRAKELFSYIPAAILPAFIVPAVFFHQGQVDWAFQKERLVVLAFATLVCYLTRSTLATISFGLISLFIVIQVS
jgi:branched-subunit amino acid transport protein